MSRVPYDVPLALDRQVASPKRLISAFCRSLRPKQFTKNLLIFVPAVFAPRVARVSILDPSTAMSLLATAIGFSLFCGFTYVINDCIDVKRDRANPLKRGRPIAAGLLPVPLALSVSIAGIVAILGHQFGARAHLVGLAFFAYLLLTLAYSLVLKRVAIVEIMVIATLFVMRPYIGGVVIGVEPSMWFSCCLGSGALLIAASKRHHEVSQVRDGAVASLEARAVLREYSPELLTLFMVLGATGALLTYVMFALVEGPSGLALTIPFVVYGVLRYLQLVMVRGLGGAPEAALLRDRPLLVSVCLWTSMVLGIYFRVAYVRGVFQH